MSVLVASGGTIFVCYNAQVVALYVKRDADPSLLETIFKVSSFDQINKEMTEEEMFEDVESSTYLTALYNIINQIRYQRQPFCQLKVLLQGDQDSDRLLATMCVIDYQNAYTKDYNKFMSEMTPRAGPGVSAQPGGGQAAAAGAQRLK